MSEIITPEAKKLITPGIKEPNFPEKDISEDNTAMIVVMLSSKEVRTSMHAVAEEAVTLYRLGHQTIISTLQTILAEPQIRATSAGVATYEALSAILANSPPDLGRDGERVLRIANLQTYQDSGVIIDVLDAFKVDMPKTAEVITEANVADNPQMRDYVLAGAAAARQLELEMQ